MLRFFIIVLTSIAVAPNLFGQKDSVEANENYKDSVIIANYNKQDDSLTAKDILESSYFIESLDSLAYVRFFKNESFTTNREELNKYSYSENEVPSFSDSTYINRINEINRLSPIEYTYNKTVRNFIDLYAIKKKELTSRVLGLSQIYFPLFEEYLDKYNLPLEIKYLAIIESALNPRAGSRAGAKGLWQFMYYTGKTYGLKVNSLIDDRYDPIRATDAACRHLKDLHDIYKDWLLALAAYNSGVGNVNKAIRRSGKINNYWAAWPFLPRETRGYVPAFMAVSYIMNYAPEHNIFPTDPGILYGDIDTVHVNDILHFDQVAEMLNIPMSDITFLNPMYKEKIIPAKKNEKYVLRLPRIHIGNFIDNEKNIYDYKTRRGIEKDKLLAKMKSIKNRNFHIVRRGETLGHIAIKYRTSVRRIKQWNSLRSNLIRPGQRLVVYKNPHLSFVPSKKKKKATEIKMKNSIVNQKNNLAEIIKKY